MRAIRLYEFGPAENLTFEEVPDPVPAAGEVLIAVEAAGVHLLDTVLRQGTGGGGPVPPPTLPTIPGREVAGRIESVGADVDPAWAGKRVVVHLGPVPGGYAEKAVARVESLYELPEHVSAAHAVATIGTGRTVTGVLEQAALTADDVVLVTAAAGGMGSLLVQSARNAGATVVGLAGGAEKVRQVRELGAQIVVDYRQADWVDQVVEKPTVVLDGVGGEVGQRAFELLAVGGRILMFGWSGGGPVQITTADLMERGLSATWAIGPKLMHRLRELESEALRHTVEGEWAPLVTSFPLSKAADAHRALENRETVGKVVLVT
ncbi:zinc-binding dehydrogenase [Kribbella sp. DT2]|uniref:zinc-binding dehydrogenase n=1 Tax=Kribbella sp. DT2 TaxID=3393427 RepID=UPI003CEE5A19